LVFLSDEARAVRYRPYNGTAPWHKEADRGPLADPDYPYNYPVPNFGVDVDINTSNANLANAEKDLGRPMNASFKKPKSHPQDYFVPNFGEDRDIKISKLNLDQSEKNLKHKWGLPTKAQVKAGEYDKDYFVPNFG
jgi:hypothetical protein